MAQIQVGEAIGPALRRTGEMLFRPFNFKKWCAIGVAAWLTILGEGGPNMNFNNPFKGFRLPSGPAPAPVPAPGAPAPGAPGGPGGPGAPVFSGGGGGQPSFDEVQRWFRDHLALVIAGVVAFIVVGFLIYLLFRWLNSRGQFMMFEHVVKNEAKVGEAWRAQRAVGNSLFKFRIVWDLIWFNAFLVLVVIAGLLAMPDWRPVFTGGEYHFTGWTIGGLVALGLGFLVLAIVGWVLGSLLLYMVIPVMYVRQINAWPAWKLTWRELFLPNFWMCIVFFLMMIVVKLVQAIWTMVATVVLMLVTCCVMWLLLLLPLVSSAALYVVALTTLPVMAFERAYVLLFLEQFGNEYQLAWSTHDPTGFPIMPDQVQPEQPWEPPESPQPPEHPEHPEQGGPGPGGSL